MRQLLQKSRREYPDSGDYSKSRGSVIAIFRRSINNSCMVVMLCLFLAACNGHHLPALRPFESAFIVTDELTLHDMKAGEATAYTVDSQGMIYVIDKAHRHIKKFNHKGDLVATFGSHGNGPGLFALPWRITCDRDDNIYVLDLPQSRVNIFASNGNFLRSFIFSSVGFSGIEMAVSDSGEIYIGGEKPQDSYSSLMIHKFNHQGDHLISFFPMDDNVRHLGLSIVGGVRIALGSNNNLFAVQEVNPMFFEFALSGEYLNKLGKIPSFYKEPFKFPKLTYPKDKPQAAKLLGKFTQLTNIITVPSSQGKSKLVMLVYAVHAPNKFAVDIYKENGESLIDSIGTDQAPIMADRLGQIYFNKHALDYTEVDSKRKNDSLVLSKCAIIPTVGKR